MLIFDSAGKKIDSDITSTAYHSRAFMYADGFFTTIRVHKGTLQLWYYHKQRLINASKALWLDCDITNISKQTKIIAKNIQHGVLKIHVARYPYDNSGNTVRGYSTAEIFHDKAVILFFAYPQTITSTSIDKNLPSTLPFQPNQIIGVLDYRLGMVSAPLAGIKTLARTEQVLASKALKQLNQYNQLSTADEPTLCDDALVCDSNDFVIESISANVFYQQLDDPNWYTPTLSHAGVAGTFRAMLLDNNVDDVSFLEKPLAINDLATVSSLFCCNAVRGIIPVSSIIHQRSQQQAKHTQLLTTAPVLQLYEQLVNQSEVIKHFLTDKC